jgi:hypothetical protein
MQEGRVEGCETVEVGHQAILAVGALTVNDCRRSCSSVP